MNQRMRLVPAEATEEMCHALAGDCDWNAVKGGFQADYEQMIAASPNGGCVTDADLERAAEEAWQEESVRAAGRRRLIAWADAPKSDQDRFRGYARVIFRSAGLPLASEPTPAATEESR